MHLYPYLTRSNQKDHAIKAEETEGIYLIKYKSLKIDAHSYTSSSQLILFNSHNSPRSEESEVQSGHVTSPVTKKL